MKIIREEHLQEAPHLLREAEAPLREEHRLLREEKHLREAPHLLPVLIHLLVKVHLHHQIIHPEELKKEI